MFVTDEALEAYYEVRARAQRRCETSESPAEASRADALRDEIESRGEDLYWERHGDLNGLTIGEVGVGSGDFVRHALKQNARTLVLIDLSRDRLDAVAQEFGLRSNGRETKIIVANAQRMDGVDDGELDMLAAKEIIEHLTDYRPFLKECHRVLRPGGRLYLTTPNRHCIDLWPRGVLARIAPPPKRQGPALIREVFGHLFKYLTSREVDLLAELLPPGFKEHTHEFAPGELVRALKAYGFQTLRLWGTPPQMFYHELRPVARQLFPAWSRADRLSYALGDNLRVIAVRTE